MDDAINYIKFHNQSNNYSNQNTASLKEQLNQIGKTDKTMGNRLRNLTSKSKSDTFLYKITEIITKIDPRRVVDYNQKNHKKIKKIKSLLNDFKQKKDNFPQLIERANQIEDDINNMIKIFEIKEAIEKVELNKDIKSALKGTIDIRDNNRVNTNKKFKEKIMMLYKEFLNKYIENYELVINPKSNSNKRSGIEQIELLNKIHHLFYKNYHHLIDKEDQEILNKKNEIDILIKYQFYKNFLQQNNVSNQNKEKLSNDLVQLATNIYDLSLIIKDVNKLKKLKEMFSYLYNKYSAIFIESQINRAKGQTIGNFKGPYKNIYNNLKKKSEKLNTSANVFRRNFTPSTFLSA